MKMLEENIKNCTQNTSFAEALPHACSTYTLGFKSTFAGVLPPISSSGSLVLPLRVSVKGVGWGMSQHNPRNSLSYSLSHILSIIVSPLSLTHANFSHALSFQ